MYKETSYIEWPKASTCIGELLALLDEKELRWLELDELIS